MNLEEYLILKAEGGSLLSKVDIHGIDVYEDSIYLFYSLSGKEKKIDISHLESLTEAYEREVWADMLSRGYILLYLQKGWLMKTPSGDTYELGDNTCTCKGGTHRPDVKCKHLMFLDAERKYRSNQSIYSYISSNPN